MASRQTTVAAAAAALTEQIQIPVAAGLALGPAPRALHDNVMSENPDWDAIEKAEEARAGAKTTMIDDGTLYEAGAGYAARKAREAEIRADAIAVARARLVDTIQTVLVECNVQHSAVIAEAIVARLSNLGSLDVTQ